MEIHHLLFFVRFEAIFALDQKIALNINKIGLVR